jgi:hypothetical protein
MPVHKGFYVKLREPDSIRAVGYVEKRWRIARARLPQNQHETNWGDYDGDKRVILIHTPLSNEEFWSSLWHEVLHASLPDTDEGAILRAEYNLLEASRRAGLFTEED